MTRENLQTNGGSAPHPLESVPGPLATQSLKTKILKSMPDLRWGMFPTATKLPRKCGKIPQNVAVMRVRCTLHILQWTRMMCKHAIHT